MDLAMESKVLLQIIFLLMQYLKLAIDYRNTILAVTASSFYAELMFSLNFDYLIQLYIISAGEGAQSFSNFLRCRKSAFFYFYELLVLLNHFNY